MASRKDTLDISDEQWVAPVGTPNVFTDNVFVALGYLRKQGGIATIIEPSQAFGKSPNWHQNQTAALITAHRKETPPSSPTLSIADPARIPWGSLRYHRNNRSYQMLMGVCYLVIQHRLMGERKGERHLAVFDDRQTFSALFERFLLSYYQRHFPELRPRGQREVKPGPEVPSFLPTMYEDVVLTRGGRTLVIDAKCYGRIFSMRFDQPRLSAEHVRQIFYYAAHTGSPESTAALLVYAGTEEGHVAETWRDQGYEMGCVTLDLNREFDEIRRQLDAVPRRFLG